MEFLKGFIGLKGVTDAPGSGLFVNTLPGINTELAAAIASTEQATAAGTWDVIENRVTNQLKEDLRELAQNPLYNWKEVITQTAGLSVANPRVSIAPAPVVKGVWVKYPYSPFISVFLKSVSLFAVAAVTEAKVTVYDVVTGLELAQKTTALIAGPNEITFDKYLDTGLDEIDFFIGLDCSNAELLQVRETAYTSPAPLDYKPATRTEADGFISVASVGEGVLVAKLDIVCSLEKYIRENKAAFAQPLLYALGAGILTEKLNTPRTGFLAVKNLARAEELRDEFLDVYRKLLKNRAKAIPYKTLCGSLAPAYTSPYSRHSLV